MEPLFIASLFGAVLGAALMRVLVGWELRWADWQLRTAQQVRADADAFLAAAEARAHYVECVETPTGAYQVVPVLRRVRDALGERVAAIRDSSDQSGWGDGELRALIEEHAASRPPLPKLRPAVPTPSQLAAHLARVRAIKKAAQ